MLLLAFAIPIKTNADTNINEYNYLIKIYNYNSSLEVFHCKIVSSKVNNIWTIFDDNDTYYLEYNTTNPNNYINTFYIIGEVNIEDYTLQMFSYLTISEYNQIYYNSGYDYGISESNPVVYDNGYNSGYDTGYDTGYNEGFQSGNDTGYDLGYNAGLNAQLPNVQLSLLGLLGTIFMFPFKLIAMGFDVEIFGFNVGHLMIFFLWISFILGIIAILKKGVIK